MESLANVCKFRVKLKGCKQLLTSSHPEPHPVFNTSLFLGLLERFKDGETVIMAEGYLFEFERRGYLQAGHFVPEVVLEHPDLVKSLYEEFVHCGSDVVLAFTVSFCCVPSSKRFVTSRRHEIFQKIV